MDTSSFMTIHTTRRGDKIISINFPSLSKVMRSWLLKPIYRILMFVFISLERTTKHKAHLLIVAGVGLGFGMSLVVAQHPSQTYALPYIDRPSQLHIKQVKVPQLGIDTPVQYGEAKLLPTVLLEEPAIHIMGTASIGQGGAIAIQGLNRDYSLQNLNQARLGDQVFVLGSNGGWYRYTIVETRYIEVDQLNSLFQRSDEAVVLYTLNLFDRTATAVIATKYR